MVKKSRLTEVTKRRYEHKIVVILAGIVFLLVLFFYFSTPLIIKLSLILGDIRSGNEQEVGVPNNSKYVAPPTLNPLFSATNSGQIKVSGYALARQTVKLYLNGKYVKVIKVSENKNFVFEDVILATGDNNIKAKSVDSGNNESAYSQSIQVSYKNKMPDLQIIYPLDNQIISNNNNKVKIEGRTGSDVRVTVNDHWAIVDNTGNFSYLLNLQKDENKIKITAVDEAGNRSEKEITVKLE